MERSDSKLSAKCFLIYIKDNLVLIRYSARIIASATQSDHFETCRAGPRFDLQSNTVTKKPDGWQVAYEIALSEKTNFTLQNRKVIAALQIRKLSDRCRYKRSSTLIVDAATLRTIGALSRK
jgi:hypothetical protein